ncbi:hypothetical protein [Clostridium perfringens]|uniref:hypothetical protein n=1 Tax=Clostridium perfringens TaxID=1502 RepID=UPI00233FF2E1|nr:hypothetical protein [Clostridium perfringens]MDC4245342.1 hypothetical protein [Clostridium perfringens]
MSYFKCPNCGQIKMTKFTASNGKEHFYIIEAPLDGNFSIPPNGLPINIFGCENCGYLQFLSNGVIKK